MRLWSLRIAALALVCIGALVSGCGTPTGTGLELNATPCQVIALGSEVKDMAVYEARLSIALRDDVVKIGGEEYERLFRFRNDLVRYYEQEKTLPPQLLADLIRLKDQEIVELHQLIARIDAMVLYESSLPPQLWDDFVRLYEQELRAAGKLGDELHRQWNYELERLPALRDELSHLLDQEVAVVGHLRKGLLQMWNYEVELPEKLFVDLKTIFGEEFLVRPKRLVGDFEKLYYYESGLPVKLMDTLNALVANEMDHFGILRNRIYEIVDYETSLPPLLYDELSRLAKEEIVNRPPKLVAFLKTQYNYEVDLVPALGNDFAHIYSVEVAHAKKLPGDLAKIGRYEVARASDLYNDLEKIADEEWNRPKKLWATLRHEFNYEVECGSRLPDEVVDSLWTCHSHDFPSVDPIASR